MPSPAACLAVAGLLGAAAALVDGRPRRAPAISRLGAAGVVATLATRGGFGPPVGESAQGSAQGPRPMKRCGLGARITVMPQFLLHHSHPAHECAAAFASWQGFDSPLRHGEAQSSCLTGGHSLWWQVEAADAAAALALLPRFVALRTTATPVRPVPIP